MRERTFGILDSDRVRALLFGLHVLFVGFVLFQDHVRSPDEATYLRLAKSMEEGEYSVWFDILEPAPTDVVRTHGYPAFLLLARQLGEDLRIVFILQGLLHLTMLLLILAILAKGAGHVRRRQNVFLLIMLPQFQLLYYVGQVFPESLMAFLCVIVLVLIGRKATPLNLIALGTILAVTFWVRPVMLLFPMFMLMGDLLLVRGPERIRSLRANGLVLVLFTVLGPMPFALWNLRAHGVLSPVPLTGSALISNLGIWQLRLPGYGTMHYFQYNYFGREIIPIVNDDDAAKYYERYQAQWSRIDSLTRSSMNEQDSVLLPLMEQDSLYVTRSAGYTVALDKAIAAENRGMILSEPLYYIGTRMYAAVRLWVTNINLPMEKVVYRPVPGVRPIVGSSVGFMGWARSLVPFLITGLTFGVGLPWLAFSVWRERGRWFERRYLLYLICYVWMIHIPMVIQSRYTVPVHAIAIACIALMLVDKWSGDKVAEVLDRIDSE